MLGRSPTTLRKVGREGRRVESDRLPIAPRRDSPGFVAIELRDVTGATVRIERPARRVLSLVPSETESVAGLAGVRALAGRSDYCEEPAGEIEAVPTVGGTKNPRLEDILALAPDLVLANREENPRKIVEALRAEGVAVFVSEPRSPREALHWLEGLARLLGRDPDTTDAVIRLRRALRLAEQQKPAQPPLPVFVPIWEQPTMTFDGRTYASALLELLGGRNVFAERHRRYPLAADLGRGPARPAPGRDTRYPRVADEEIVARAPAWVLLPDEPYRYGEREARRYQVLLGPRLGSRPCVRFVSGKDLFWYGVRTAGALDRLARLLDTLRGAEQAPGSS